MDNTGRFDLPLILPSQAQKHVTHNEALTLIDGLFHLVIKTFGETTPPVTAQIDDAFVIGASPTGAWFGQAGNIAFNSDVGWRFLPPRQGIIALNAATAKLVVYDQSAWKALGDAIDLSTLGINTNADAVNRLAVRSNAALFIATNTSDGGTGDVQIKLSKELASDTASHLFQTAFSGRAEIGLTGDDDFHLKVSPNGSTWSEAIKVDKTSALVTLTNNSVGNAALADMASARIKGRATSGTGDPEDLSGTQATALLDAFTTSAKGLAPASGGGTVNYLRADGTWAAPASGGGGEANTASNINVGGVAIFKQKTGMNFEFRGINAASSKVTVALDAVNNEIDVDVAEASLTLGNLGGSIDLSGAKASGVLAAARFPALTGDVTNTAGTLAATIASGAVSNGKLANVATATFKGRASAGSGVPEDLSSAQATALIDVFTGTLKGHAPASGGGTANFLRADGTWATPAPGGVSDGDKGDITVSGSGAVWAINSQSQIGKSLAIANGVFAF